MKTITQVAKTMQTLLGPVSDQLAIATGFCQRKGKLSGSSFVQALVFGSLEQPGLGYSTLVASAHTAGAKVTKQALEQRFTERSAALLLQVLEDAVQQGIGSTPAALPLLERFHGVYVRDSSVISLPKELEGIWPGSASSHGSSAGVKLHTRLEMCSGQLGGPVLAPGRQHDRRSPFQSETLPQGALRMGDLGFYSLQQFALDSANGVFWLSRYKCGTVLRDLDGQTIDLLAWLRQQPQDRFERPVLLGNHHLAARLLVVRVPPAVVEKRRRKLHEYARKKQVPPSSELMALCAWTILVTNIPPSMLSIAEALVLLRVRWQIELLFKRWKSLFQIDQWRSNKPWRILTELYAKLLAVVVQQWCLLTSLPHLPQPSFWQAALVVRKFATCLAIALHHLADLISILENIDDHIRAHCRLLPRSRLPSLFQLLEACRV